MTSSAARRGDGIGFHHHVLPLCGGSFFLYGGGEQYLKLDFSC
jgi:hypothetical protein